MDRESPFVNLVIPKPHLRGNVTDASHKYVINRTFVHYATNTLKSGEAE